jgi:2,3-bisphosphoglycerate-independent phosphoglycerate mutase
VKYCLLIMDGASGWPLGEKGGQTCLELAATPNLDALVQKGTLGTVLTVPTGMEPSSACACMSLLGYDPKVYYKGRASIEAASMGVPVKQGEAVFRCNLVSVEEGRMNSYCAGHISDKEAAAIVDSLNKELGNQTVEFFAGKSYRHLLKLKGNSEALKAACTPPHDIPGKKIAYHLPKGRGGGILRDLMQVAEAVLKDHPVNKKRQKRGLPQANGIWLFWGSGPLPPLPVFKEQYGLKAAITSAVDLLNGLGQMTGMEILKIKGVTDGPDNAFSVQAKGALAALKKKDLIVIHVEAPDEMGHAGNIEGKVKAIEKIDEEVLSCLREYKGELRLLITPDHPTPIALRTHVAEAVPFLLVGKGFKANGAAAFSEAEAKKTGLVIEPGFGIMEKLVRE